MVLHKNLRERYGIKPKFFAKIPKSEGIDRDWNLESMVELKREAFDRAREASKRTFRWSGVVTAGLSALLYNLCIDPSIDLEWNKRVKGNPYTNVFEMVDIERSESDKREIKKRETKPKEEKKLQEFAKQKTGEAKIGESDVVKELGVEGSKRQESEEEEDKDLYTEDLNLRYGGFVRALDESFNYDLPIENEREIRQFIKTKGDSLVYSLEEHLVEREKMFERGRHVGWTGGEIIRFAQQFSQLLHYVDKDKALEIMERLVEVGIEKDLANVDLYAEFARNPEALDKALEFFKDKLDLEMYDKKFGLGEHVRYGVKKLFLNDGYQEVIDEIGANTGMKVRMDALSDEERELLKENKSGGFWRDSEDLVPGKTSHLINNLDIINRLSELDEERKEKIYKAWQIMEKLRPFDYLDSGTNFLPSIGRVEDLEGKLTKLLEMYPNAFEKWNTENMGLLWEVMVIKPELYEELVEEDTPGYLKFRGDDLSHTTGTIRNLASKRKVEDLGITINEGYRFVQVYGNFNGTELREVTEDFIEGQSLFDYLLESEQLGKVNQLIEKEDLGPSDLKQVIAKGGDEVKEVFESEDFVGEVRSRLKTYEEERKIAEESKEELKDLEDKTTYSKNVQDVIDLMSRNQDYNFSYRDFPIVFNLATLDKDTVNTVFSNLYSAGWVMKDVEKNTRLAGGNILEARSKEPLLMHHITNPKSLEILSHSRFSEVAGNVYGEGEGFNFSDLGLMKSFIEYPELVEEYKGRSKDDLEEEIEGILSTREKWVRERSGGWIQANEKEGALGNLTKSDLFKVRKLIEYFNVQGNVNNLYADLVRDRGYNEVGEIDHKETPEVGGQTGLTSFGIQVDTYEPGVDKNPHMYVLSDDFMEKSPDMIASWHSHPKGQQQSGPSSYGIFGGDLKVSEDNQWDGWVVSIHEDKEEDGLRKGKMNIDYYTENGDVIDLGMFHGEVPLTQPASEDTTMNYYQNLMGKITDTLFACSVPKDTSGAYYDRLIKHINLPSRV
jgi:hypothetical protein